MSNQVKYSRTEVVVFASAASFSVILNYPVSALFRTGMGAQERPRLKQNRNALNQFQASRLDCVENTHWLIMVGSNDDCVTRLTTSTSRGKKKGRNENIIWAAVFTLSTAGVGAVVVHSQLHIL